MVSNSKVIEAFLERRQAAASNLSTDGFHLWSYATCIAQWSGSTFVVNQTKYSRTTSKHLTMLTRALYMASMVTVSNIPIGTYEL